MTTARFMKVTSMMPSALENARFAQRLVGFGRSLVTRLMPAADSASGVGRRGVATITLVLMAALHALAAGAVTLVKTNDPGYYNASIGTALNGTNGGETGPFPVGNDGSYSFPNAPDLSAASAALGNWLTEPQSLNGNWSLRSSIPNSWAVGTEVAVIYRFNTSGATNVVARFGVDNGIFAWLDGHYLGGARRGGGVSLGEHVFPVGDLTAGVHHLQLLLEDHGATNGYAVEITADTYLPCSCEVNVPTIVSLPPLTGTPGTPYSYVVNAIEPGNPTLSYQLIERPVGMTINNLSGLVAWTPADSQVRAHPVEIEARDPRGRVARQRYYIDVRTVASSIDTIPPTVALRVVQGNQELLGDEVALPVGQSVELRVEAADDVGVTQRILLKDGIPLALDDVGRTTLTLSAVGKLTLVATARDQAGNTTSATRYLRGYDPNDDHLPTVVLHAPTMDTTITAPINVVATVADPVLESYTVDFARADLVDLDNLHLSDPDWVHLGGGPTSVTNAVVGRLDPTILTNDSYVVRVVAQNVNGRIQSRGVIVNVSGDLKLGEFRIAFTDLTVPVTGVPITVTRVYDSRQSRDSRDFGYGWSLGMQDARILEVKRNALGYQSLFPGSRVYINTPDGRRVGFTAYSASINCFGFCFATVGLRPDPGVYEKLDIADDKVAVFYQGNYLGGLASGPFDPERYNLTLKDGTVYEYSQTQGLLRVRDLNGNRLEVTAAGVFHYPAGSATSDRKIDYIRDAQGRITQVIDPDGHPLTYAYDAAGDLRSFRDQANNTSSYDYHAARPHYLATITDPLGHQAVRTEFDAAGRVVSITDALGNPVTEAFDVDARTGTFTDANGNVTLSLYDDRGNVIRKTDPEGGVWEYEFDANNNETRKRDPLGRVTRTEYDGRGNVTRVIDALGNSTVTAYNALNKPTSVTDVLGHTNQFSYDAQGQLLELRNAVNDASTFTRDSRGRVTSVSDFAGHTTLYDYTGACPCGAPSKVTNPDGTFRLYEYNSLGQVTQETDELGRVTVSTYDADGRLISVRDPDGHVTAYAYNGPLKISETDPLGRITRYAYDAGNHQISITDNAGGVTRFEYDKSGNKTALADPVGNRTEFVYDGNNRLVRQIDPLGKATRNTYDAGGNLVRVVDRNGRTRDFQYDALNRRTREQWSDSSGVVRTLNFTFNALGLMTGASDPASTLTFNFDALNRVQSTTQSNVPGLADFTLNYAYDDMGNVTSVTDNYGVQVASTYDVRNRLQNRSWQGGGITGALVRFGYDAAGNKTTVQRYSDVAGTQLVGQSAYAFNGEHAITHIRHANAGGAALLEFDYTRDAAQQITRRLLDTQTTDYTYDVTGQLTGADYSDSQPDEAFSYDLNGNRTMAGYTTGPGNRLLSDGKYTYAYDLEGNLVLRTDTSNGAKTTYAYDHRNRMVGVVDRDAGDAVSQTVAMTYDVMGRRIAKASASGIKHYRYETAALWADLGMGDAATARYLMGSETDEFVARSDASGALGWYLRDNVGSAVALADGAGVRQGGVSYSVFGQMGSVLQQEGAERIRFAGREWDSELRQYFHRARYRDPWIGNFVSQDPLQSVSDDINLYRYVGNAPLDRSDPHGLMAIVSYAGALRMAPLVITAIAGVGLVDGVVEESAQRAAAISGRQGLGCIEEDALRHCIGGCLTVRYTAFMGYMYVALGGAAREVFDTTWWADWYNSWRGAVLWRPGCDCGGVCSGALARGDLIMPARGWGRACKK